MKQAHRADAEIRIGIGGWTYDPWRWPFYHRADRPWHGHRSGLSLGSCVAGPAMRPADAGTGRIAYRSSCAARCLSTMPNSSSKAIGRRQLCQ